MKSFYSLTAWISRIKGRITRELLKLLKVSKADCESLLFGEYESTLVHKIIETYAEGSNLVVDHPREKLPQSFSFGYRALVNVSDVLVDAHTGLIFTPSKKIVEESSAWEKNSLLLNSMPKPFLTIKKIKLEPKQNPILLPSNGFYHWLIEDLAPFLFAYRNLSSPLILVHEDSPKYVKSFLELLNGEVEFIPRFVSINSLNFTTKIPSTGWVDSRDTRILREFFQAYLYPTISGKKIYISRLNSRRSPWFEEELITILMKNGWKIVEAQKLNLIEQITEISTAEVICGVGGAGLAGAVWLAPGSKVIELSPNWLVPCFSRLSDILQLSYDCIMFEKLGLNAPQVATEIFNTISN